MKELAIDYEVIYRSESSEDLEEFLVSYTDNEQSRLHVIDYSDNREEWLKSQSMLNEYGFVHDPGMVHFGAQTSSDFDVFKSAINFDKDYQYFSSDRLVFCFGGQLFDDTLDILIQDLKQNKCLAVSPLTVDCRGTFYDFEDFNPNCFVIDRRKSRRLVDGCKSFTDFVSAAKINHLSLLMSNGMVFG